MIDDGLRKTGLVMEARNTSSRPGRALGSLYCWMDDSLNLFDV